MTKHALIILECKIVVVRILNPRKIPTSCIMRRKDHMTKNWTCTQEFPTHRGDAAVENLNDELTGDT